MKYKRSDLVGLKDRGANLLISNNLRELGVIVSIGENRVWEQICTIYWFNHPSGWTPIETWYPHELFLIKRVDRE